MLLDAGVLPPGLCTLLLTMSALHRLACSGPGRKQAYLYHEANEGCSNLPRSRGLNGAASAMRVKRPRSDADRDHTLEVEPVCVTVDAARLDPVARELLYYVVSVERAVTEVLQLDATDDARAARRRTIDLRYSILELLEVVDAYALDEEALSTTTV